MVWSLRPEMSIMWSASSSTNILIFFISICSFLMRSWKRPGVPMQICDFTCPFTSSSGTTSSGLMVVYLPSVESTSKICRASSREGTTHIACGHSSLGLTFDSIEMVNAAVLPVPDCACAMRCEAGLSLVPRVIGRAAS
eukprot:Mycagemm_TRINITY_DN8383_c0_g1::TRINITY_DN8383_c0_g1_i1::g.5508::m.5508 type:complete len:139 gc:universal TRINITY_DN8383_c0_g1_i1:758-1174(+)